MDRAKKERMMKMDRYLSCSAGRNAARQAAQTAYQKRQEKGSGSAGRVIGRTRAGRGVSVRTSGTYGENRAIWGAKLIKNGIVLGGARTGKRAFRRPGPGVLTAFALILVMVFAVILLSGCGSAEKEAFGNGQSEAENAAGGGTGAGQEDADTETETGQEAADTETGAGQEDADTQTGTGQENADTETGTGQENVDTETETGQEDADAQTGTGQYEIPEVVMPSYEIPDTEAFAFVRSMKIGWNLGNTLDSYNDSGYDNELDSETNWVGVATTKEMIDDIRAAGFQTMRVPVTWHGHFTDENFTISQVWLDRVQEIVDYGIDNGMYVILNIHHDNREDCFYPDQEHLEGSIRYIESVWGQLAARFADYDEHLIFEAMNEPRLVGSVYEWWLDKNSDECNDAVACINTLNQAFVDTVRAGGGNNGTRYLMVPGYDASPDGALHEGFVLPTDAAGAADRILVSVHAYTPYGFALQGAGESGSTSVFASDSESSTRDIDYFMDRLYERFISQGIPVVIGEFGARNKDGNTQDRVDYAAYYIAAARARGMSCLWWDNNAFNGNGENFGLYYRRGGYFIYPDIVAALMKYAD